MIVRKGKIELHAWCFGVDDVRDGLFIPFCLPVATKKKAEQLRREHAQKRGCRQSEYAIKQMYVVMEPVDR